MRSSGTIVICLLLTAAMFGREPQSNQHSQAKAEQNRSRLISFTLQRPNLVAVGSYLSRVQICGVPSGTGIDPTSCNPIGKAVRTTPAGMREKWVFTPPPYPVNYMVTEVYAKAYDAAGKVVGRKSLPIIGVSGIEATMYPSADPGLFSHQDKIGLEDSGKDFVFADDMFPFSIVLDDARYRATDFVVNCDPKYDANHPIIMRMTRQEQDYHHLPGTAFYTATPGTCRIQNLDFAVTIKVLHGDWRD